MKMPVGAHGIEPARGVGGVAVGLVVQDDDVGKLMVGALVEQCARNAAPGPAFGPRQGHQAVGLAHAQSVPGLVGLAAAEEKVVVTGFEFGDGVALMVEIAGAHDMHTEAVLAHVVGQFEGEGFRVDVAGGGEKGGDARLDRRGLARRGAPEAVGEDVHQGLVDGGVLPGEAAESGGRQA